MAAAIKTCIKLNQIDSIKGLPTADFVEKIDKLFDALNSKHCFSKKPCNLPLKDIFMF